MSSMAHFSHPLSRFFTQIEQIPEIIPFIGHRSLGEGGQPHPAAQRLSRK